MKKYCLVSDDSGHDYVIPSNMRTDWYKIDFEYAVVPEWAYLVAGGLEFENPTDFDKSCFPKELHSTTLLEEIEAWLCFNKEPDKQNISDLHKSIKSHLGIE